MVVFSHVCVKKLCTPQPNLSVNQHDMKEVTRPCGIFIASAVNQQWQALETLFYPLSDFLTQPSLQTADMTLQECKSRSGLVIICLYASFYTSFDPLAGISWVLFMGFPQWILANFVQAEVLSFTPTQSVSTERVAMNPHLEYCTIMGREIVAFDYAAPEA